MTETPMRTLNDPDLRELARGLRKRMTKEERRLWYDFFKKTPYRVNRQRQFGNYIVDFFIAEVKLVIELDGSQHYSEQGRDNDRERDAYLKEHGLTVLRYSNYDVNTDFEGVCLDIQRNIEKRQW